MSMNDTLANALSHILNCEKVGKTDCTINNPSKVTKDVMEILKSHGYINKISSTQSGKGKVLVVELKGTINKCGAIKPRFPVKISDYEKYERRYLPAKDFGVMLVSTTQGIMTHDKAMDKNLGGKLIAYCY